MDFNKKWSHYVLHHIDSQKLDQMIINLKCNIPGYRSNNKKILKGIPKTLKVTILNKKILNEKKWSEEIGKLYKKVLERKEVKIYLEMTPTEFLSQIETFKAQHDQEVQIGVVNYFLQSSTTLETERERIVEHFYIEQIERNKVENQTTISQPLVKEMIADKVENKKDKIENEENEAENQENNTGNAKEALSRKQIRNYKMVTHMCQDLQEKMEVRKEEIKKLNGQLEELHRTYNEKEESYRAELKDLELRYTQLNKDYQNLELVNKELERKLKQTKAGMPYVFIGSSFIKKKVENIKSTKYPNMNVIYTSTEQWQSGLAKASHEVAEVYIFFYDMEWLKREQLHREYEEKLKVFKTDDLFYEYITQHWEA